MTLDSWIFEKNINSTNLLLQMDIEGGEWNVLETANPELLSKFRIMVIEFHNLHLLFMQFSFDRMNSIFTKILNHFFVVHFHPNNYDFLFEWDGIKIPSTAEITFIRKDLVSKTSFLEILTSPLDVPNSLSNNAISAEEIFDNPMLRI